MSESIFVNFEPLEEDPNGKSNGNPEEEQKEEENVQETVISSKDFSNIQPFHTSRYGNSRLFTATKDGMRVVIKALKAKYAQDPKYQAILKKEYDITSQIDSHYVRKVLSYENISGLGDCIIMEYINGKTLAEHIRVGTLSEKQIKTNLVELCDALTYLHQRRIVHCDLKPENILITENDHHVKLIDIGLAETNYKGNHELPADELEFIAPELVVGEENDPRSDVFSVGKIMELISNRGISKQFVNIATHCTQFSKEQRFNSTAEVKAAMTKKHSATRFILLIILIVLVGILAYAYIPKMISSKKQDKAKEVAEQKMAAFLTENQKIAAETDALIDKYRLTMLNEPLAAAWQEDSIRLMNQIEPFVFDEQSREQAMEVLESQSNSINAQRQNDFDVLLVQAYQNAQDTTAIRLQKSVTNPSDSVKIQKATEWYRITKK